MRWFVFIDRSIRITSLSQISVLLMQSMIFVNIDDFERNICFHQYIIHLTNCNLIFMQSNISANINLNINFLIWLGRLFMYLVETYFRSLVSRLEFITQCYDNKSLSDCISAIICLTVSNYSRVPDAFTVIIFN